MTNQPEIFCLDFAGINCWDVKRSNGRFAGLIVQRNDGTFRHFYNGNGTKGSSRKFPTLGSAIENIDRRLAFIKAKRAA